MGKRVKFIFLMTFLMFASFLAISQPPHHFIIASGSEGGSYFKVANYIANQYNKRIGSEFTVIQTNGSLENLDLLKNNYADFAIVLDKPLQVVPPIPVILCH